MNDEWVSWDGLTLFMWVHRISEVSKFQHLSIMLFSETEIDCLQEAISSLTVPSGHAVPVVATETTNWCKTSYETDYEAGGQWVTAENGRLVMKVKRSTVNGNQSKLRIEIRTLEALRHLVETTR